MNLYMLGAGDHAGNTGFKTLGVVVSDSVKQSPWCQRGPSLRNF